jgi:hypothetical protein
VFLNTVVFLNTLWTPGSAPVFPLAGPHDGLLQQLGWVPGRTDLSRFFSHFFFATTSHMTLTSPHLQPHHPRSHLQHLSFPPVRMRWFVLVFISPAVYRPWGPVIKTDINGCNSGSSSSRGTGSACQLPPAATSCHHLKHSTAQHDAGAGTRSCRSRKVGCNSFLCCTYSRSNSNSRSRVLAHL